MARSGLRFLRCIFFSSVTGHQGGKRRKNKKKLPVNSGLVCLATLGLAGTGLAGTGLAAVGLAPWRGGVVLGWGVHGEG